MARPKHIEWNPSSSARLNAHTHLPKLAKQFFRAGREIVQGKHPPDAMHKFRLRTKHLRYTLELFREIYGPAVDSRLELLKPIQDALGDLNDCATARELLGGSSEIRAYLKKRAKNKVADFGNYWRETFDAPGQRREWLDYLAGGRS